MWSRKELKAKAKVAFKANYWKTVIVAAIYAAITAAASSAATNTDGAQGESLNDLISKAIEESHLPEPLFLTIVMSIVSFGLLIALAIEVFAKYPVLVGCSRFFVKNETDEEKPGVLTIFSTFGKNYLNVCFSYFLTRLVIGLWSLLLIIPGLIKSLEYRMVRYILAEDPSMGAKEAMALSKKMMKGEKWNLFVLDLSFIGWGILGVLTGGIADIFYVRPYKYQTDAELYLTLKNK